jgi:hypothetical protein
MRIEIKYKNGMGELFDEKQIDCSKWTIRGHASNLIEAMKEKNKGIHNLDNYNAIVLDEVMSVRVV